MDTNTITKTQKIEKPGKNQSITYEKTHRPEGYVSNPKTLEGLRDLVESWRHNKKRKREAMPLSIWNQIADFCIDGEYTSWQVSHHLRIGGVKLRDYIPKRQAELAAAKKEATTISPQIDLSDQDWAITCKRADGQTMNISGNGYMPDVKPVIDSFLVPAA